jgi:hypothetical protein
MAKFKKAPGRLIGRWKAEALAAHRGASDQDLAKIINDTARQQGYACTITPDKVRAKSKKERKKRSARPAPAALANAAPAPRAAPTGISLDDVQAVKGLVERIGAAKMQELAGMLSR